MADEGIVADFIPSKPCTIRFAAVDGQSPYINIISDYTFPARKTCIAEQINLQLQQELKNKVFTYESETRDEMRYLPLLMYGLEYIKVVIPITDEHFLITQAGLTKRNDLVFARDLLEFLWEEPYVIAIASFVDHR